MHIVCSNSGANSYGKRPTGRMFPSQTVKLRIVPMARCNSPEYPPLLCPDDRAYPGLKWPRLFRTRVHSGLGQFIPREMVWPRLLYTPPGQIISLNSDTNHLKDTVSLDFLLKFAYTVDKPSRIQAPRSACLSSRPIISLSYFSQGFIII